MHCFAQADAARTRTLAAARVQPKLQVGPVDDPLEREADRAADAMMQGEAAGALSRAAPAAQRMCAECGAEEDGRVQRKCATCAGEGAARSAETAAQAVSSGGAPLSPELRAYFEPRLGRGLSDVRIHTGGQAADAARGIDARAYTLGRDVAFAAGEYSPGDPEGRRLLAHELAHVAQQSGTQQSGGEAGPIRRTVAGTSACAANTAGAGGAPLDDLRARDAEAQRMSLGASNVLALEALTFRDPTFGPSYVAAAYRRRFGPAPPAPAAGRFRNRFNSQTFPNQPAAEAAEMSFLSDRFRGLHTFLSGAIRYRCPGNATITVGGCTDRCGANDFAWTCVPNDARTIAICPGYWGLTAEQQAGAIVHEAVHMRLNFAAHSAGGANQRGRNPECYTSLILDLYRQDARPQDRPNFNPADPKCPPI